MEMARKSSRRSDGQGRFVRLFHWMLQSPAWQSLSPVQRALYLELAQRYTGFNNGRIGLSARDAAEALGSSKSTVARAFAALVERGFIEQQKRGHFDRKSRHASEWRLTIENCDVTGALASKAFMKWGRENKTGPSGGTVGLSGGTDPLGIRRRTTPKKAHGPSGGTVVPLYRARTVP
jgi:hypothetical protein